MVKVVHGVGEEGKVAVRNIRRDVMHDLRELKKEGEVGEDDERRAESELQKRTDAATGEIDEPAEGQGGRDPRGVSASLPRPAGGEGEAEHSGGPRYVAIITDGNGRWAAERGLPAVEGHRAGADTVKARLRDAAELGIEELTVFSFSTENWHRPPAEVDGLMAMFAERIDRETPELDAEGVRMRFIGRRERVAAELRRADGLGRADDGRRTTRITLFVAFNYGGRAEIIDAARSFDGGLRGGVPQLPVRPRDERPRPAHPHQRRTADLELPALAVRLLGARLPDRLWPEFDRPAFDRGAGRVRDPQTQVRGQVGEVEGSRPFDSELDFDHPRRNRPAPPAAAAPARAGAAPRGGRRRAPEARSRDAAADRVGAAVDRGRDHDRDRRRRAVRGGDDRLRLRRDLRAVPDDPRRTPVPDHRLRRRRRARRHRLLRRPVRDDDRPRRAACR